MKRIFNQGRWNRLEKEKFLQSIALKNLSWVNISHLVGTRSPAQCRSHYQKMIIGERIKKLNCSKNNSMRRTFNEIKENKCSEKNSAEILELKACNDSSTEDRSESIQMQSPEQCDENKVLEISEDNFKSEFYPDCDSVDFEYYNF